MLLRARVLMFSIGALVFLSSSIHAAVPVHLWSHGFPAAKNEAGFQVAIDPSGNVIIIGRFGGLTTGGSIDLGGGPLTSVNGMDVFLAKYDANGVYQWSKSFGGIYTDEGRAVAVDAAGNIIVTGDFYTSIDLGGGPLTSVGDGDIFLAKLDPNGSHIWSKSFGSPAAVGYGDSGWDLAIDAVGNIVMCGQYEGATTDFGGGPLPFAGAFDIFVTKLDPNGAHIWSKSFGSAGSDRANACALDAAGNVVVTGLFQNTVDFGGGPLTSAGSVDMFVAKYDATGVHQWSRRAGSTSSDLGEGIATDSSGNVVVTGAFRLSADFGGGPLAGVAANDDIFLAKYDATGAHLWSKAMGASGVDGGRAVAVTPSGNIVIDGAFSGTVNFGGGPFANAGIFDQFLAEYDANGNHVWSEAFGSNAQDELEGIAVDGNRIAVIGEYSNPISYGGPTLSHGASTDVGVAEFVEDNPVPVLFTRFSATARNRAAVIDWSIRGDEGPAAFTLYHREKGVSPFVVVASGDASTTHSVVDASVRAGKTYEFQVGIRASDGDDFLSPIATVTIPGLSNTLEQNQPNPFNPITTITYTLAERVAVAVEIFDASGRLLTRLDQGTRDAGTYHVQWNGTDLTGRPVASGVYFYRLSGVREMETKKMVLLK